MDSNSFYLRLTLSFMFLIGSASCNSQEKLQSPTHTKLQSNNTTCVSLLEEFVKANSKFTSSAGLTAEPFEMCIGNAKHDTLAHYQDATLLFNELINDRDSKTNKSCASEYINLNRMNILVNLMENSNKIWQSAFCEDCYENSALSRNQSNHAKLFLEYSMKFDVCIKNNSESVCKSCENDYNLLNKLYEQMMKSKQNKICFDLVDKMNKTRVEWSVKYFCCHNKKDDLTAFIALASTMTAILIAFYGTVYTIGMRNQPTITLDDQEVTSNQTAEDDDLIIGTNTAGSSSSSMNRNLKKMDNNKKKLVINGESDDDELIDNSQNIQNNLITLDENE
ncbi:unnamed protein product [Diamesa serratosioi]